MSRFGKIVKLLFLGLISLSLIGCGGRNNDPLAGDDLLADDILNPIGGEIGADGLPVDGVIGMGGVRGDLGTLMDADSAGLSPVFFSYDSSTLSPSELSKVQMAAQYMASNPGASIVLEGHADERGSREYNVGLGERRALSVRRYLVQFGVDASAAQTRSFGEEQPAVFGHDESAWTQNRRVEFKVYR